MIKNFFVIKAYNNADKYALAVGLLADEIAGCRTRAGLEPAVHQAFLRGEAGIAGAPLRQWLLRRQVRRQDRRRVAAAIKAFQAKAGLTQDGHPSMEVLEIVEEAVGSGG